MKWILRERIIIIISINNYFNLIKNILKKYLIIKLIQKNNNKFIFLEIISKNKIIELIRENEILFKNDLFNSSQKLSIKI
jgi:hypothetical protein